MTLVNSFFGGEWLTARDRANPMVMMNASDNTDPVDAAPVSVEVGRALRDVDLEAVLIGNAAAARQDALVTTVDFPHCATSIAGGALCRRNGVRISLIVPPE